MTQADVDNAGAGPEPTPSTAFERLPRAGAKPSEQLTCVFLLGAPLVLFGAAIIILFVFMPKGEDDLWIMAVVGGMFGGVGLLLLIAGLKGWRSRKIPWTELSISPGATLRPGQTARLRLRQPGPVALQKLTVTLVGERVYRRRVSVKSHSTVEDQEQLCGRPVLEIRDTRVREGKALERERNFTIPDDARPSGPTHPDGHIRWRLDVVGQAGFMRGFRHPFELSVSAHGKGRDGAPSPETEHV
ncbi:MAG TPA: hypothetical protein PLU25_03870 [Acidobacteriota bacterium]|nr:hypothetical protein [Acidobacteriota bacterium]